LTETSLLPPLLVSHLGLKATGRFVVKYEDSSSGIFLPLSFILVFIYSKMNVSNLRLEECSEHKRKRLVKEIYGSCLQRCSCKHWFHYSL